MPTQAQLPVAKLAYVSNQQLTRPLMVLTCDIAPFPKVVDDLAVVGTTLEPGSLGTRLDIDVEKGSHIDL